MAQAAAPERAVVDIPFGRECESDAASPSSHSRQRSGSHGATHVVQEHAIWPSTRWETIMGSATNSQPHEPWNKGKMVGQKAPFKVKDI